MLITGAAGGIGRAVVQLFNEKGWIVVGVDRQEFGKDFPSEGMFIQSDISEPGDIQCIYEETRKNTQLLDAVINNAAVQIAKPLLELQSQTEKSSFLF